MKSISIIYPFFNEERRITKTIKDVLKFNRSNLALKKEFIFVNDGSSDTTSSVIKKFSKNLKNIKLINLKKNKGKGYALKEGIKHARYEWTLTSDSDCSVSCFQIIKWIKTKDIRKEQIYFGSRNLSNSIVKKKMYRKFIGRIFSIFTSYIFNIHIKDTQCGFKLYQTKYAKKIFKKIITNGYMHDIEVYLIAKNLGLKIIELPVKWTHIKDSKISFFKDGLKILFNLYKIKKNEYKYKI